MRVVKIEWIDASYNSSSYDKYDVREFGPVTLETVGWLVEERPDCYILAMELHPRDNFRYLCSIPKSGVVKVTGLRVR